MFDIGFSKNLLIFVIALVVLGPEKLPRLASQVGRWIGRARSMARQFQQQLEEEVNLEQVRKAQAIRKPEPQAATEAPSAAANASDSATSDSATGTPSPAADSATIGPDPVDLRDDTFSHAHPTNEYGANPYTANGSADSASNSALPPTLDPYAYMPSEANVAAAQPEPRDAGASPPRPPAAGSEEYSSPTHPTPAPGGAVTHDTIHSTSQRETPDADHPGQA